MKTPRREKVIAIMLLLGVKLWSAEGHRGTARADRARPEYFPHRIWAACDFESRTAEYSWFGVAQSNNIPVYAGNQTALRAGKATRGAGLMTGINPVPGPRMGKENYLYVRYFVRGSRAATFQYFSLTTEDNNHIEVTGLTENAWSEATLNFTRDAKRNDGTPGIPFHEGERMDDFKVFLSAGDAKAPELLIDDVIFFANDPDLRPESEPFPKRIIYLAAFDTGPKEKYWPGDFEIAEANLPPDSYWRVARAVPRKEGQGKLISLPIEPVKGVGAHTKLRFRYHLTGTKKMIVQIFDATVQDNRHIALSNLTENGWKTIYLDFTRDSRRNDGSAGTIEAGNLVDAIFFFVSPEGTGPVKLLIDEVVLFDAGS